jgi:metallo-beta-lactamase family protein
MYPVRAKIVQIDGFSAHADREELIQWLTMLKKPPRRIFVTHGEAEAIKALSETIKERLGYNVTAPAYLDQVSLD